MDKGAKVNVFTAFRFWKFKAFPGTLHALGPHGLTLLHHAVKAWDNAPEAIDYLKSLGATAMQVALSDTIGAIKRIALILLAIIMDEDAHVLLTNIAQEVLLEGIGHYQSTMYDINLGGLAIV